MRALPRSSALGAALLAAAVLAAGCTSNHDTPARPETGDSPAATPLVDRLLPTGTVPGLNAQWHWQDGDTATASTKAFGVCAKADLLSIGAGEAVERTYFPPDDSDDFAAEQVAEFPDTRTANLAWSVLKSWHDKCSAMSAKNPGLKVGALTAVPVTAGSARWYLLSWVPAGEETGRFEAFGMVLVGTRLAVLRMDNSGQDHSYPPGQEPMAGMVRAAAGWLD